MQPAIAGDLAGPVLLGAAAERFARNTLRKSAQTRRTYLSVYRRFAEHLAEQIADPNPGPPAMTADAVAGYLDMLEHQGRSKATVRKERAALNRLTRHLQLIGAIEQTTALEILDVEASTQPGSRGCDRRWMRDVATRERPRGGARARAVAGGPRNDRARGARPVDRRLPGRARPAV